MLFDHPEFKAALLDGFFLLAAGYAGCDPMLVGFFFMIAVASRGFLTSSTLLNPIDLSPNYAATIAAISNGCGSVLGFLVPLLVAWVTPNVSGSAKSVDIYPIAISIDKLAFGVV